MKQYFVAAEDTDVYNVFSMDDFTEDGYLAGYRGVEGYHFNDFDPVAWFDTFEEACEWMERHERY